MSVHTSRPLGVDRVERVERGEGSEHCSTHYWSAVYGYSRTILDGTNHPTFSCCGNPAEHHVLLSHCAQVIQLLLPLLVLAHILGALAKDLDHDVETTCVPCWPAANGATRVLLDSSLTTTISPNLILRPLGRSPCSGGRRTRFLTSQLTATIVRELPSQHCSK